MHHALRSSLAIVAILSIVCFTGCQTHDRRNYSMQKDKNLHTPDPWAPSTTQAADEATSSLAAPPQTLSPARSMAPGSPPVPGAPVQ